MIKEILFAILFIIAGAVAFALVAPLLFGGGEHLDKVAEAAVPLIILICGPAGFIYGGMRGKKQQSNYRTGCVIAVAVAAAIGLLLSNILQRASESTLDKLLVLASKHASQSLPMKVDEFTSLVSIGTLPGGKLIYKYTVTNRPKEIDFKARIENLRPTVINTSKTTTELAKLLKAGATLVFVYFDETGAELARFEVTPDDIK